jgi:hypothetical protein
MRICLAVLIVIIIIAIVVPRKWIHCARKV